jgi:hypothetical protein
MATLLCGALLIGCGSAQGAAATAVATATCPPTPAVKSVTGHITATSGGTVTVTDASGSATAVQVTSTTRITRIVPVAPAAIAAGTPVLVLTDTNATTARRISVLPAGAAATGGTGFGGGRFSGTPVAGANRACFQRGRRGTGQGTGQSAGQGAGTGFQGLRGTVDSATSTRIVFDDAQGQTYSVAITSATLIQQTATALASSLIVGTSVMVSGTPTASGITARTVAIQA